MLAPRKTLHSTPLSVFRRALRLVHASPTDVLYDLGCGDGRLLLEAARSFGMRAVGVEIDPQRAEQARLAAERAGVGHLVTVHCANALEFAVPEDATVVFLFLISRGLSLVRPMLEKLRPECRVITYLYRIPHLEASERHLLPAKEPLEPHGSDSLPPEQQQHQQQEEQEQEKERAVGPTDVAFPIYIYRFPTQRRAAPIASQQTSLSHAT